MPDETGQDRYGASSVVSIRGPFCDVGPVPGGPTAHGPAGLGKYASLTPLVDSNAGYPESLGDLGQADGLASVHDDDCTESLDKRPARTDNQYMTEHEAQALAAPRMTSDKRTKFYSRCSCGWVGASRSTLARARRDADRHEKGLFAMVLDA